MFRRVYGFFRSLFLPFFVSPSFLALPAFSVLLFFALFIFPVLLFPPFPSFSFLSLFFLFPSFLLSFSFFPFFFSALPTFPALLFAYIRLFYRCSKNGRKMPDKEQRRFFECVYRLHIWCGPRKYFVSSSRNIEDRSFTEKNAWKRGNDRKINRRKGMVITETGGVPIRNIHMLPGMPPEYSVNSIADCFKGKRSLSIYERCGNARFLDCNREFWRQGNYVDLPGENTQKIHS